MHPNLNDLIQYRNSNIISRYKKDFPDTTMQAEEALIELMKFIWLCRKHKDDKKNRPNDNALNFSCVIHSEMKDIDNMWHTFLLFTRDYHAFCDDYLNGTFFHHDPLSDIDNNISRESYELELTLYLSYVYDNLGEDTLIKWFNK
jgi:hypothetical protein